jgi:hypothetical protein
LRRQYTKEELAEITTLVGLKLGKVLEELVGKVPTIAAYTALLALAKQVVIDNANNMNDQEKLQVLYATFKLSQEVMDLLAEW